MTMPPKHEDDAVSRIGNIRFYCALYTPRDALRLFYGLAYLSSFFFAIYGAEAAAAHKDFYILSGTLLVTLLLSGLSVWGIQRHDK